MLSDASTLRPDGPASRWRTRFLGLRPEGREAGGGRRAATDPRRYLTSENYDSQKAAGGVPFARARSEGRAPGEAGEGRLGRFNPGAPLV